MLGGGGLLVVDYLMDACVHEERCRGRGPELYKCRDGLVSRYRMVVL